MKTILLLTMNVLLLLMMGCGSGSSSVSGQDQAGRAQGSAAPKIAVHRILPMNDLWDSEEKTHPVRHDACSYVDDVLNLEERLLPAGYDGKSGAAVQGSSQASRIVIVAHR